MDHSFEIVASTDDSPEAYVVSANIHRRHLTAEQKRDLIAKLIKADPEKSDRQIAKTAKVDHKTVGAARSELEGRGEIPHVETRTDTTGRKQPAKKKTNSALREKAQARREAMRKRAQELSKKQNAGEAALKAKAAELVADLMKANLARQMLAYLRGNEGDLLPSLFIRADILVDALKRLLDEPSNDASSEGNDLDPEQAAEQRKQEFATMEGAP